MTDRVSRRDFLRALGSTRKRPLRPPWAVDEEAFVEACTRCGDCRTACPTGIVVLDRDANAYPALDFHLGECTFCTGCVSACHSGALRKQPKQAAWQLRAAVGQACLAQHRVECRICGDLCLSGAIRFASRAGGMATPLVDAARCTGCGACVAPCPTRAIDVR
ncbi:ferredoxin-type protein NapF [Accumulibacter sp.]|uniref:ferredoxin-type protein NapF n=1 Tax=Accumulibacter sp. TaxID=2053492 RepID=UPI00261A501E|nr:ferredoxin-type protein NapF [Accumulibacter sp.]